MNETVATPPARPGIGTLIADLLETAHTVEHRVEGALAQVGLSRAKLNVLRQLGDEALPLGQLAERCACVKSNMTQLVDRLEADGLARRVADPDDRRCIRAELTPEGRARRDAGLRIVAEVERGLLDGLCPHRSAEAVSLLRELRAAG